MQNAAESLPGAGRPRGRGGGEAVGRQRRGLEAADQRQENSTISSRLLHFYRSFNFFNLSLESVSFFHLSCGAVGRLREVLMRPRQACQRQDHSTFCWTVTICIAFVGMFYRCLFSCVCLFSRCLIIFIASLSCEADLD